MKVLLLSHGHPTFSIGGAEVASYALFNAINRLPGCAAHYLAHAGGPIARHRDTPFLALRQGADETFFRTDAYDHFRLSNRDVGALAEDFAEFLRELSPDIVHFHHVLGFGVEAIHAVRRAVPQAPIVLTLHEYLAICHNHGQMIKRRTGRPCSKASPAECGICFPEIRAAEFMRRELFMRSFYDRVDAFVSPSRFLAERYTDWGVPGEKLAVLENGLEIGAIAPPRRIADPRRSRRNRFAYFGQLNQFKGIKVLLEAVVKVPAEIWGPDGVLHIFGGNLEVQPEPFQREFRQLLAAAGRRVRFFGSYRSDELPTLMQEVDWVVVPSVWWENSPVVIQEAFLHGRPVICSDIGGMAEKVRNGVDGLHFRAGSAESLTGCLIAALRRRDLWQRLRSRIRKPLSADAAARQHHALYTSLLGRRAALGAGDDRGHPADPHRPLAVAAE